MKKLNKDKLSQKQIDKIKYKAAFSQFVQSLKSNVEDLWKCCNMTFCSVKYLHKHVSCNHMDAVTNIFQKLNRISSDAQLEICSGSSIPVPVDSHCCSCSSKSYVVILFYQYVDIQLDLHALRCWQEKLCHNLELKGKIRLAREGINGTLEGCQCSVDVYTTTLIKSELFGHLQYEDFKCSDGTGQSFDELVVSTCNELCTMGIAPADFNHTERGKYLTPEQFHIALENMQKLKDDTEIKDSLVLLDCRNFYESKIGYFQDAVTPDLRKFSYFPKYVEKNKDLFEGRDVLTYCTGGIRCERATAFIKKATNCSDVYQLQGGIHKYLEKYPNGFFKGRLFVFDNRYSIGSSDSEVTSSCFYCQRPCNEYRLCAGSRCRQLVLICEPCSKQGKSFCCELCLTNHQKNNTTEQCSCTAVRERIPKENQPS